MTSTVKKASRIPHSPVARRRGEPYAGFALFDTAIGRCGIAWSRHGIVCVQLPETRETELRAGLLRKYPDMREATPPREVRRAIAGIAALLRGEQDPLSGIRLDMEQVSPFHRRVYETARTIAPGSTRSYGDIAAMLGSPRAARAVGQALGRNPFAIIVPCHRVLAADGRIGGFSASGGIASKFRLLAIEAERLDRHAANPDRHGGLQFNPNIAIRHLRRADPVLARLIDSAGPFRMRPKGTSSVFAALAEAIVHQQLSGKAAVTIYARLCALFPRGHEGLTCRHILGAPDRKLRSAGLSQQKILSLRDLARQTAAGGIPTFTEIQALDDDAIVQALTQVRGIGRWTAEMLLIFRLGRPDVLPLDDYGIRHGYSVAFRKPALPSRADLAKRGERWRPYRTVASWYLWRAVDLARNGT